MLIPACCYFTLRGSGDLVGIIKLGGKLLFSCSLTPLSLLPSLLGSCRTYP